MFLTPELTHTATENARALSRANESFFKELPNMAVLSRAVTSGNAAYGDYRSVANALSSGAVLATANMISLAPGAIFVFKDILSNMKRSGVEIPGQLAKEFDL